MSNRRNRRNLRRIASRKGITYEESIKKFYSAESLEALELMDKNLVFSLQKKSSKMGKDVSSKSRKKKRQRRQRNEFFRNNSKPVGERHLYLHDPRES